ncbi:response regulator [Paenibacillus sp. FSL W8-0187]|uniref:response regulator transcription factor n=1 Tax=Paenibacillus sp. FSL W8-0187 TaxID=2921710 RepID=UPI0030DC18D6
MRILVVDDEVVIRKGILKLLETLYQTGTSVDEARNGEEAMQRVIEQKPDLIITDIQMPVMNGLELIGALRDSYPDIEWVILTGFAEFEYVQQALRHQVSDYLLKPVTQDNLNEVISKVLLKDPAKWTSQMDIEGINIMKDIATSLVKAVISEKGTELDLQLDKWRVYCKERDFPLIQIKQMMGHLQLLFRSELFLNVKLAAPDESSAMNQSSMSTEELLAKWREYLLVQMAMVAKNRAPRNKRIVDDVLQYIEQHYHDTGLGLSVLANRAGVSTAYLSKIFREVMRKPITQYIGEFRLEQARRLLKEDEAAKINVVAERCGFQDYPYFSKVFKKSFGISPLEFREKSR